MFELEVNEIVELEIEEFNSLILNKNEEIRRAQFSNMTYMSH